MKKRTKNILTTIVGVVILLGILPLAYYECDYKVLIVIGILGVMLIFYKNDPLQKVTGIAKILKTKTDE